MTAAHSDAAGDDQPPLATIVLAGEMGARVTEIAPGIFRIPDMSNVFLITSSDGDVLINAGFQNSAERNYALLAPHRRSPLRMMVLTQSHADHFGGVPTLREATTEIVAGAGFIEACADTERLQPFFGPRSAKLWGSTLAGIGPLLPSPVVTPDILIDRHLETSVGGRRIEVISTPDGETADGLTVWLPDDGIAFVGNLFGPVWLSMPFLNTLRGDKPRSVRSYLTSLEIIRALDAETIATGHGDPIRGRARIRSDLDRVDAAVRYVRNYTLDGMAAGRTVDELMSCFTWPAGLSIGEFHGKASLAIRSIWREYAGWFHYEEGTTALYAVPRSRTDPDVVELAGAAPLVARARERLIGDAPLEALHLVAMVLSVHPQDAAALRVKRDAHQHLLECAGTANLSETMWLREEIAACERLLQHRSP